MFVSSLRLSYLSRFGFASAGLLGLVCAASVSAHAQTLSGAILFSTDATGNASGGQIWNTLAGDGNFNLWLRQGASFVNGPADAQAGISIPLTTGTYTYAIYGEPGGSSGFDGLNLFFDGNTNTPRLSAFGATQTTAAPSPFAADSGNTLALNTTSVAGAGTLTYVDGATTIVLSNFTWAVPAVNNTDLVGSVTTGASGNNDFVGSFTLNVRGPVAVPEPGSVALLIGLATTGAGFLSRRKRARA